MGWRPIVKSWLNEMPPSLTEMHKSTINDLFERFCDACIQLIRKGGVKELCPTTDTNMIKSLMNLMDCQMDEFHDEAKISQMEEREIMTWLEVCISKNMNIVVIAKTVKPRNSNFKFFEILANSK